MSDDIWRSEEGDRGEGDRRTPGRREAEMDSFGDEEFGGPLFGDTSETPVTGDSSGGSAVPSGGLKFDDESGSMPHWTEPATGEIPNIESPAPADPTDDLDVWSSFTSDSPVWKEGDHVDQPTGQQPVDPTGELTWEDAPAEDAEAPAEPAAAGPPAEAEEPAAREPARITIGTDQIGRAHV